MAKLAAEVQRNEAQNRVAEPLAQLAEIEKLARTEEQWFSAWKQSKAYEVFANEVG